MYDSPKADCRLHTLELHSQTLSVLFFFWNFGQVLGDSVARTEHSQGSFISKALEIFFSHMINLKLQRSPMPTATILPLGYIFFLHLRSQHESSKILTHNHPKAQSYILSKRGLKSKRVETLAFSTLTKTNISTNSHTPNITLHLVACRFLCLEIQASDLPSIFIIKLVLGAAFLNASGWEGEMDWQAFHFSFFCFQDEELVTKYPVQGIAALEQAGNDL